MGDANRLFALCATANEKVLAGLGLSVDKDDGAVNIALRSRGGCAESIDHDLVVVGDLVDPAVGDERRRELGGSAEVIARRGLAVPDGLQCAG